MSIHNAALRNLLYAGFTFITIFILFSAFFGFDYSDEGYTILLTSPHQPPGNEVTLFPALLSPISAAFDIGIREFRMIRLIVHLLTTLALAGALKHFVLSFKFPWLNYFTPFIFITSFTIYILFPNNISYFTIAYNLIQLMVALLIYHFSALFHRPSYTVFTAPLMLSLITAVLFYAKLSSAAAMCLMIIVLWGAGMLIGFRRKHFMLSLIVFCSFTFLWFILMEMWAAHTPSRLISQIKTINSLQTTHSTSFLLLNFGSYVIIAFILMGMGFFAARKFDGKIPESSIHSLIFITALIISSVPLYSQILFLIAVSAAILFSIGMSMHFTIRQEKEKNLPLLFIFTTLFGATTATFIGTNNPNLYVFTISSGILLPFALFSNKETFLRPYALFASVATIVLTLTLLVFFPYRQAPMYTMTEWVKPPVGGSLLMNPNDAADIEILRNALKKDGFQSGDPLFTPFRLPGLVYILDGYSPGGILWSDTHMPAYMNRLSKDFKQSCNPCILVANSPDDVHEFLRHTPYSLIDSIPNTSGFLIYHIEGSIRQTK